MEVTLCPASAESDDSGPMLPAEIARVRAAMRTLPVWDLPNDSAAELDAWENLINQHGIEHRDSSMEKVFR